jgi:hypothetical protein
MILIQLLFESSIRDRNWASQSTIGQHVMQSASNISLGNNDVPLILSGLHDKVR